MRLFVEGAGILAPGLAGWPASRPMLTEETPYLPAVFSLPAVELLPAVERRRTGLLVKLALAVGQEVLANAGRSANNLATVFASSDSDGEVIHDICSTLAGPDRQVSPTRFHNSVHNAPSGYWSIATQSREPSTSLCGLDWSFAIGLLEAATQVDIDKRDVLLIAYDLPYPEPLLSARRVTHPFGAALLLTRNRSNRSIARAEIAVTSARRAASRMRDPLLEQLRSDNPAARALPLLTALARPEYASVVLDYVAGNSLEVTVSPC